MVTLHSSDTLEQRTFFQALATTPICAICFAVLRLGGSCQTIVADGTLEVSRFMSIHDWRGATLRLFSISCVL